MSAVGTGSSTSCTRAPRSSSAAASAGARASRSPVAPAGLRRGGAASRPARSPAIPGSGTGPPYMTAWASAQSATRANGPTVSKLGHSGKTPSSGAVPTRGLSPTTPQHAAGMRTEPPVSVPSASETKPAATAAALPLLEPPVMRPGSRGLCASPQCALCPVTPHANSSALALPTTIAPCASSAWTIGAERAGTWSA